MPSFFTVNAWIDKEKGICHARQTVSVKMQANNMMTVNHIREDSFFSWIKLFCWIVHIAMLRGDIEKAIFAVAASCYCFARSVASSRQTQIVVIIFAMSHVIVEHSTGVHHVTVQNKLSSVIKLRSNAINDAKDKRCDNQPIIHKEHQLKWIKMELR